MSIVSREKKKIQGNSLSGKARYNHIAKILAKGVLRLLEAEKTKRLQEKCTK